MSNRADSDRTARAAQQAARFETTGDLVVVLGDVVGDVAGVDNADSVDDINKDHKVKNVNDLDRVEGAEARLILYLSSEWEHVFHRPIDSLVGRRFAAVLSNSTARIRSSMLRRMNCLPRLPN